MMGITSRLGSVEIYANNERAGVRMKYFRSATENKGDDYGSVFEGAVMSIEVIPYCTVKLKHVPTGKIITLPENGFDDSNERDHRIWWSWAEGNNSCDCNRQIMWNREHGIEWVGRQDKHPCGGKLFEVLITRYDAHVIYDEFEGKPRGE